MNKLVAHAIDNAIELTLGSMRLVIAGPKYHTVERLEMDWLQADPLKVYALNAGPPEIMIDSVQRLFDDRAHARFHFPSPVSSPHSENNIVHGLADMHEPGRAPAALILLHGYQMRTYAPLKFFAEPVAQAGLDIYYMALPYHMRRAPRGSWSGEFGLSADVEQTVESFRQGVLDLRTLITYIREVKQQQVAIAGLSLGAFTCCATALVDDRPFALISLLGGGSLADIIFAGFSFRLIRKELQESGVTRGELENWWRLLAPANWQPRLAKERILMVAGKHDPIITPRNTHRLWQAWNQPRLDWIPCGHASVGFYTRQIGEKIAEFLVERLEKDQLENHRD
jgi:pimeloyl-ACP methyl ester carboxylesterase